MPSRPRERLHQLRDSLAASAQLRRVRHPVVWGTFRRRDAFDVPGRRGISVYEAIVRAFVIDVAGADRTGPALVEDRALADLVDGVVDVVTADPYAPNPDVVADIAEAGVLEAARYRFVLLTASPRNVEALAARVTHAWDALRPGGRLLVCCPTTTGAQPLGHGETPPDVYARAGALQATAEGLVPAPTQAQIGERGGFTAMLAHLGGLAAGEIRDSELAANDERFAVAVCALFTKP